MILGVGCGLAVAQSFRTFDQVHRHLGAGLCDAVTSASLDSNNPLKKGNVDSKSSEQLPSGRRCTKERGVMRKHPQ
jgi:hypothetical protein